MSSFRQGFIAIIICTYMLLEASVVHAMEVKGTLTRRDFTAGNCRIASMTVKYHFSLLLGEPTVDGSFKWVAGNDTARDCLGYSTKILVKIAKGPTHYGYIKLAPTVPKADQGYGFNTKGSPNWGSLIIKGQDGDNIVSVWKEAIKRYDEGVPEWNEILGVDKKAASKENVYFSADNAKAFWKTRFSVVSFEVLGGGKGKKKPKKEEKKKDDDFWSVSNKSSLDKYLKKKKEQEKRAEQERLKKEFEEELKKAGLKLGEGDVQITLTWDNSNDVDLHVTDPSGETIWFRNNHSRSGGTLDVDDTNGHGPENVFWPPGGSPPGKYKVEVKFYSGRGSTSYKVRIFANDRVFFYKGTLNYNGDTDIVTSLRVQEKRK